MAKPQVNAYVMILVKLFIFFFQSIAIGLACVGAVALCVNSTHVEYVRFSNAANFYVVGCWESLNVNSLISGFYSSKLVTPELTFSLSNNCLERTVIERQTSLYIPFCLSVTISFLLCHCTLTGRSIFKLGNVFSYALYCCVFVPMAGFLTMYTYSGQCYPLNWGQVVTAAQRVGATIPAAASFSYMNNINPPCFPMLQFEKVLVFLFPFFLTVLFTLLSDTSSLFNRKLKIYTIFSMAIMMLIQGLYNYYMPSAYQAPTKDVTKMLYRILLHPAVMEVLHFAYRLVVNDLDLSTSFMSSTIYMIPGRFSSMFSRLLMNSVSDEVLQAVTAILCGLTEIVLRLSVGVRANMINSIQSKITGKPSVQNVELRNAMIFYDTSFETMDTLALGSFFVFILLPTGPLAHQRILLIDRDGLRNKGFKVEKYIMVNVAVQIVIEFGVLLIVAIIEVLLSQSKQSFLNIVGTKEFKNPGFQIMFFIVNFLLTYWFVAVLFMFPQKGNDVFVALQLNMYDLYNTWIYIMPTTTEILYVKEFVKEFAGGYPSQAYSTWFPGL